MVIKLHGLKEKLNKKQIENLNDTQEYNIYIPPQEEIVDGIEYCIFGGDMKLMGHEIKSRFLRLFRD